MNRFSFAIIMAALAISCGSAASRIPESAPQNEKQIAGDNPLLDNWEKEEGLTSPPSDNSSIMDTAKAEIASNDVIVFSKSYCPYCTKTKRTLSGMGINAKVIELNQIDNGDEMQGALLVISGQRTVPNVFVKGQHLGGNDDTQAAARSGKLQQMLGK